MDTPPLPPPQYQKQNSKSWGKTILGAIGSVFRFILLFIGPKYSTYDPDGWDKEKPFWENFWSSFEQRFSGADLTVLPAVILLSLGFLFFLILEILHFSEVIISHF
jgi:hypothetical protein